MRALLPFAFLLAGCGTGDTGTGGNGTLRAADAESDRAVATAVQTATLTGLYEGGDPARRNQMCIVERGTGDSRFGLVLWGAGDASCSGAGVALRQGQRLRLTMAGDEPCAIEARIDGARVAFPATLPAGCAYYCGARATMAGAAFEKVGGTAEEAMRATDLVGDPLCG